MTRDILMVLGAVDVQAELVEAAQARDLHVIVCAREAAGPAVDLADEFALIDITDVDQVSALASQRGVRAVYSVGSDLAMPTVGRVSEQLALPHFASSETARTCNSKPLLRAALRGSRWHVPHEEVSDLDHATTLGFPVFVKPADSQGQRGVSLVTEPEHLRAAIERAVGHSRSGTCIVEQFLDGPEVSVNGYLVDGELRFCLISDRETWPQYTGLIRRHVIPSVTDDPQVRQEVTELVSETSALVGLRNGPVYVQVKITDGHPRLIEITPRLDGCHMWRLIKQSTGVDLLDATLTHLLGGEVTFLHALDPAPVALEFSCQPPHTAASYPPDDPSAHWVRHYYRDGDLVRPVNGRFEKTGFTIRTN